MTTKKKATPKTFAEFVNHELNPTQDMLFEMSNLYPEDTGLPMTVWISSQGDNRSPHGARIKVAKGRRPVLVASVAIGPPVTVVVGSLSESQLRPIAKWIDLNRDVLLEHWRNEISAKRALDSLKPLPRR